MSDSLQAQIQASHPRYTVFVSANAGSGKTSTLVTRVARLLLDGAAPEAMLCVTYTKAAAAEMQRRLFEKLGDWAVAPDPVLRETLVGIDEGGRDLSKARSLFARALETPGGLKIQTLHAFCEKLLRRFPLEAGTPVGFTVLEDAEAREISQSAREALAVMALETPEGPVGGAYAKLSSDLDFEAFQALLAELESRREAIRAYVDRAEYQGGYQKTTWGLCGFDQVLSSEAVEAEAAASILWPQWRRAAEAIALSGAKTDLALAEAMRGVGPHSGFDAIWSVFVTQQGTPRSALGTKAVDGAVRDWMKTLQGRLEGERKRVASARVAEQTVLALTLAVAHAGAYAEAKGRRGGLDFVDLIQAAVRLLTERADAAWVLFKLDGGIEHILLDEAQDTAPEQWDILRALTDEFFSGLGTARKPRTLFAVGDEKQSIFSFQGARPERLAVETHAFRTLADRANARFRSVPLEESWRSAPQILTFVDAVIAEPEVAQALRPVLGENVVPLPILHAPRRADAGCVDMWPLEQAETGEESDVWAPVDALAGVSAEKRLATRIAGAIAGMVARGEAVVDRETRQARACAPGDVLILVRRRGRLFEEILRALKRAGVPVAGADRLKLSSHGAFHDLLAIGRFAGFAQDDLTLATLLRGPFCDVDEDGLFDLAHKRDGALWDALRIRAAERAEWADAVALLSWVGAESRRSQPFDLYARLLARLDREGRSMRQRLLTRMGSEAEDAIDAFLAQVLAAERAGRRDLESCLAALARTELEVKREMAEDRVDGGAVRVMTAHGAKGLEAPIVILPDTTMRANSPGGRLLETDDGGFIWKPRKADDCDASARARAAREKADAAESARLLYVAMTRARDRLIICGVQTLPRFYEGSWYDFMRRAFDASTIHPFAMNGGGEGWRFGPDPEAEAAPAEAHTPPALPTWSATIVGSPPAAGRFVAPTALGEAAPGAAPSPLARRDGLSRYRRGDLIHRLFEHLPDLPQDARADAATRLLARELDLTDAQRSEIARSTLMVLEDPRFAAVFGPGSRAEVSIAGTSPRLPAGMGVSGRLDRLVIEADRVLIVDFKSNRPVPADITEADDAYITQLAIYWAVVSEIYPDRPVAAALLWTDGPRLTPAPKDLLEAVLAKLK